VGGSTGPDRIELRHLRILGTHGVLPEERVRAQPFAVDLDLEVDLSPAASSDHLADTVDYGEVVDRVVAVVSGPRSYQLLEALAGAIADQALTDTRVASVTVSLRKLRPPVAADIASVGVRVTRRR
jgi:dihydroneopterin aldolase